MAREGLSNPLCAHARSKWPSQFRFAAAAPCRACWRPIDAQPHLSRRGSGDSAVEDWHDGCPRPARTVLLHEVNDFGQRLALGRPLNFSGHRAIVVDEAKLTLLAAARNVLACPPLRAGDRPSCGPYRARGQWPQAPDPGWTAPLRAPRQVVVCRPRRRPSVVTLAVPAAMSCEGRFNRRGRREHVRFV